LAHFFSLSTQGYDCIHFGSDIENMNNTFTDTAAFACFSMQHITLLTFIPCQEQ
jgi:hypothetical protein